MSVILCIDTATKACSVALWKDDCVIALKEIIEDGYTHAERLHVLIDEMMSESELSYSQLDAIAAGRGPGSYTGLRIGVSAAKGLAFSSDAPLISIPTLKIIAAMAREQIGNLDDCLIRPLLDARRMEVYSAAYDLDLNEIDACAAHIIDEESFAKELRAGMVFFCGDGMEKCQVSLSGEQNARFISNIYPSARFIGELAQKKLLAGQIEDVAYFEPYYLKEFVAKPPKKML